jgi:hypothetical protein
MTDLKGFIRFGYWKCDAGQSEFFSHVVTILFGIRVPQKVSKYWFDFNLY